MTAPCVLGVGRLSPALVAGLSAYDLITTSDALAWSDHLASIASEVRAVVAGGFQQLPDHWLARFPNLELVAIHGTGTDGLDVAAANGRGVRVTNTPDVLTEDVADLAVGLALAVFRRIVANDRFVRDGSWAAGATAPLGMRLGGRKVGLLGMGRIGQAIARRLDAFGVTCRYTARHRRPSLDYGWYGDPRSLARAVDMLIVTLPGGPSTRHLVDAPLLEALGSGGILVNVARGSVVDEAALLDALRECRIAGAGLDVFQSEPSSAMRFAEFDTVVLQPHQGSATSEARQAMAELVLANLAAWFADGRLITPAEIPLDP